MKIWEMDYRIQFSKVSVVKRAALLVNCEFEIIPPLSLLGMDNNEPAVNLFNQWSTLSSVLATSPAVATPAFASPWDQVFNPPHSWPVASPAFV